MTLRKKLMLSFLILVLLMGSMIGYFSYQNAKNLVLENKEQEMADTINRIDISINRDINSVNCISHLLFFVFQYKIFCILIRKISNH